MKVSDENYGWNHFDESLGNIIIRTWKNLFENRSISDKVYAMIPMRILENLERVVERFIVNPGRIMMKIRNEF